MALTNIQPVVPNAQQPSALENAAKVLGIGISLGDLGLKAYGLNLAKNANTLKNGLGQPVDINSIPTPGTPAPMNADIG